MHASTIFPLYFPAYEYNIPFIFPGILNKNIVVFIVLLYLNSGKETLVHSLRLKANERVNIGREKNSRLFLS